MSEYGGGGDIDTKWDDARIDMDSLPVALHREWAHIAAQATGEDLPALALRLLRDFVDCHDPTGAARDQVLTELGDELSAAEKEASDEFVTRQARWDLNDALAITGRPWVRNPMLVALDVDGVINPFLRQPGHTEHDVTIPAGLVRSPFLKGHGDIDLNSRIGFDPGIGAWIRSLIDSGADVVWATSWEQAANTVLAPLLGIPTLPVAVSAALDFVRFDDIKNGADRWKRRTLEEKFPDRAIIWIDDNAGIIRPDFRPAPWTTIAPDPQTGLQQSHRNLVDDILRRHLSLRGAASDGDR